MPIVILKKVKFYIANNNQCICGHLQAILCKVLAKLGAPTIDHVFDVDLWIISATLEKFLLLI